MRPYTEFFLVRLFPYRTEYGDLKTENTDQKKLRTWEISTYSKVGSLSSVQSVNSHKNYSHKKLEIATFYSKENELLKTGTLSRYYNQTKVSCFLKAVFIEASRYLWKVKASKEHTVGVVT